TAIKITLVLKFLTKPDFPLDTLHIPIIFLTDVRFPAPTRPPRPPPRGPHPPPPQPLRPRPARKPLPGRTRPLRRGRPSPPPIPPGLRRANPRPPLHSGSIHRPHPPRATSRIRNRSHRKTPSRRSDPPRLLLPTLSQSEPRPSGSGNLRHPNY